MIDTQALLRARRAVESNIGEKVRLKANRGRRKSYIKEGIIDDTYGNVFTVRVDVDTKAVQTLSYTYSDLLTSNVELVVCRNNKKIYAG
ncbi:MAG: Veg family protein [Caldicoprobacterales bacterium]|nr:Veg family protein [Clostridia bacterium]MDI9512644.1 Veg family protein [Bacillota bacterium]NLH59321.1 Veg protein [Clostridiales bacterium]